MTDSIAAQAHYQVRFGRGAEGLAVVGAAADVIVYVDVLPGVDGEFTEAVEVAVPSIRADLATRTAAAEWMLAQQVARGSRVSVAVIAASDGAEDTLGAGAVIDALATLGIDFSSPEAAVVCAAFTSLERAVGHLLTASVAGRALVEAGRVDLVSAASGIDSRQGVVA
ncbi:hypothetical protein KPL76_01190 [Subtercola sp. PAMC28395]|uniref:hypothetical protein n=1 Tax=Subtercola sp. PAMC28395 TaxID=2846775 RepID=UPI001C0B61A8|nr:hypothetical protein [Subtercola sp. PAMC28395]QWT24087.1 hypothetical protein KPL76_01190 [Subtercola sp. PAMC28395]